MKNRFPRMMEEDTDFNLEAYLVPTASHKVEIIETNYEIANSQILATYFPELFQADGTPKKKMKLNVRKED